MRLEREPDPTDAFGWYAGKPGKASPAYQALAKIPSLRCSILRIFQRTESVGRSAEAQVHQQWVPRVISIGIRVPFGEDADAEVAVVRVRGRVHHTSTQHGARSNSPVIPAWQTPPAPSAKASR